jgi:hypothetical protein
MYYPNLLAAKNPCPPHLSLIIAVPLYECHPIKVLSTQQRLKSSSSCPLGFLNKPLQ